MSRTAGGRLGPAFTNLWVASLASNLGDGIARTAMPLLAARLTDDALLVSGIAALAMLPWLLFALPSGIAIDRMDRRLALALAQAVRVTLGILLIVLTASGALTIWWLYLVIFVYGAFETLYDGAARAIPPSIVDTADLPRANGRIEAGEQVMQSFVSGPFTSALFAVSVLIPLGTNVAAFALAGVLALLLPRAASGRQHVHPDDAGVAWYRQFADGWRFLRANRMLVVLWLTSTAAGIFVQLAFASFVLFVLGPLGVPEAWFGLFMLSGAVGGIAGSLVTDRLKRRFHSGPVMAWSTLFTGLALLVMGPWPNVWVVVAANAVVAGAIVCWNVLVISLRQAIIPIRLFGRVQGTWRTLLWGAMPVGSLLGGLIGRVDLALPFVVGGGLTAVLALAAFPFYRRLPDPEDVVAAGTVGPAV
ncbi:MAG: MFS transporter [Actinobacteria bacterium]|nr:MFS transporter [Actinomycetota bacterium]